MKKKDSMNKRIDLVLSLKGRAINNNSDWEVLYSKTSNADTITYLHKYIDFEGLTKFKKSFYNDIHCFNEPNSSLMSKEIKLFSLRKNSEILSKHQLNNIRNEFNQYCYSFDCELLDLDNYIDLINPNSKVFSIFDTIHKVNHFKIYVEYFKQNPMGNLYSLKYIIDQSDKSLHKRLAREPEIAELAFQNNITEITDLLSDDVKRIAGVALEGNHRLQ